MATATISILPKTQTGKDNTLLNEDQHREKKLNLPPNNRIVRVSISWTVKSRTISGEVDLDASCLIFDKCGKFIETIFWDNLTTKGIIHKGDEKLEDEEESSDKDEDNNNVILNNTVDNSKEEIIEVNFDELNEDIANLVFVLNIFNNKTFANLTKIEFKIYPLQENNHLCKYSVLPDKLKKIRDNNTLIISKIFRKSVQEDWFVRVLSNPQSIAFGQVVDVLIPIILKEKEDKKANSERIVEPLVKTWELIKIEILEGRCLSVEDSNGRSDPFVKIECGKWKRKTSVKKETLNPTWSDAKFELLFDDTDEKEINFHVKDFDRLGKNEFIGQFQVSIPKIPPNKEINRWFRLQPPDGATAKKKDKTSGSIYVRLHKISRLEM